MKFLFIIATLADLAVDLTLKVMGVYLLVVVHDYHGSALFFIATGVYSTAMWLSNKSNNKERIE